MSSTLQISIVGFFAVLIAALYADVPAWFRVVSIVVALLALVFTAAILSNATEDKK